MTKRDQKSLFWAALLGGGGFLTFWYFLRPRLTLREIAPATVKWETR